MEIDENNLVHPSHQEHVLPHLTLNDPKKYRSCDRLGLSFAWLVFFYPPQKSVLWQEKQIPVCQGMMNWSQWMSCRWDTSDFEGWEWIWKELFFIFSLCLKRKTNMELKLIDGLRRYVLFEENMFRFHASFWECTLPKSYTAFEQSLDWRTFFMSSSFLPSTKLFFLPTRKSEIPSIHLSISAVRSTDLVKFEKNKIRKVLGICREWMGMDRQTFAGRCFRK